MSPHSLYDGGSAALALQRRPARFYAASPAAANRAILAGPPAVAPDRGAAVAPGNAQREAVFASAPVAAAGFPNGQEGTMA